MSEPLYDIGDVVYLKESAALGFLEAVRINSITRTQENWIYTVAVNIRSPVSAANYGDRRSVIAGATLYYDESEFITICDALDLIESNLQLQLDKIRAQKASLCSSGTE